MSLIKKTDVRRRKRLVYRYMLVPCACTTRTTQISMYTVSFLIAKGDLIDRTIAGLMDHISTPKAMQCTSDRSKSASTQPDRKA